MNHVELIVEPHEFKWRLEDFLCDRFRRISRMHLRELVRDGYCEVNGRIENIGKRLKPNDFVEIDIDLGREFSGLPQDIPLDIVYEDADLLVVNKPAGMLAHPTHRDKNGTLLNALNFHLNSSLNDVGRDEGVGDNTFNDVRASAFIRPGLIHRLDKDTSGLMVVAKNARSHRQLSSQFYRKTVEKKYVALVDGNVVEDLMTIDLPIGRFAEEKRWGLKDDGKASQTNLRVLERKATTTLVELEPVTGRTNQLRIHCEGIGHPIVGDVSRGGREFERLCLHAFRLSFQQPTTRELLACETSTPMEFSIN
jgi:23S rRNA pseudouridine1911/1915/1917 synthase